MVSEIDQWRLLGREELDMKTVITPARIVDCVHAHRT